MHHRAQPFVLLFYRRRQARLLLRLHVRLQHQKYRSSTEEEQRVNYLTGKKSCFECSVLKSEYQMGRYDGGDENIVMLGHDLTFLSASALL